jgi:DNA repair protein RadC
MKENSNNDSGISNSDIQLKLNINQWAEEDRPREKLGRLGAEALSNAELLAILIGSGSTKESAVDLMKRLLADCNNNLKHVGKEKHTRTHRL